METYCSRSPSLISSEISLNSLGLVIHAYMETTEVRFGLERDEFLSTINIILTLYNLKSNAYVSMHVHARVLSLSPVAIISASQDHTINKNLDAKVIGDTESASP